MRFVFAIAALLLVFFVAWGPVGFVAAAYLGEATGWYRIEDHMCTIEGEDCHSKVRKP